MKKEFKKLFFFIFFISFLAAEIIYSPRQPNVEEQVSFTVRHPDGISEDRVFWNFGDGTPPGWDISKVIKIYRYPGTYTVKVDYWTRKGDRRSEQVQITVVERRKVIFSPPFPRVGQPVSFKGKNFFSSSLSWDFGDGTRVIGSSIQTHIYSKPGRYKVRVKDWSGDSVAEISTVVEVIEKPRIMFTPQNPRIGDEVHFEAINFLASCIYWDFGDGTGLIRGSAKQRHIFKKAGTFVVKAYDHCGDVTKPETVTVTVFKRAGGLSISRIKLYFDEKQTFKMLPLGFKPFKAYAEFHYKGSGTLQFQWLVDEKPITFISKELEDSGVVIVDSGESPGLPTDRVGIHSVTIRLVFPSQVLSIPVIKYSVEEPAEIPFPGEKVEISGIVRDLYTGKPIADATVIFKEMKFSPVTKKLEDTGEELAVVSDRMGRFKFENLTPGTWFKLEAFKKGYSYFAGSREFLGKEGIINYILQLKPRRIRVIGRVKEKLTGKPVKGLVLALRSIPAIDRKFNKSLFYTHVTRSDLNGNFVFQNIEPESENVLYIKDYRFEEEVIKRFRVPSEKEFDLGKIEVTLKRGKIEIAVVDEDSGQPPVWGGEVYLSSNLSSFSRQLREQKALYTAFSPTQGESSISSFNDGKGYFQSCHLVQGKCVFENVPLNESGAIADFYLLSVKCPFYKPHVERLKLTEEERHVRLTVHIEPVDPMIFGRVLNADTKEPVYDAKIEIFKETQLLGVAHSDSEGKYTFKIPSPLREGESLELHITKKGYRKAKRRIAHERFSKGPLRLAEIKTLLHPFTATVTGVVRDEEGNLLRGVKIFAGNSSVFSEKNGEFRLVVNMVGEEYRTLVNFFALGFKEKSLRVKLKDYEIKNVGVVVLKRRTGKLSVKVIEEKVLIGPDFRSHKVIQPLPEAKISLLISNEKKLSEITNREGIAVFENVPLYFFFDIYVVGPEGRGFVPFKTKVLQVKEEKEITVKLEPGGEISGWVRDKKSGLAVKGAIVKLEGSLVETTTNANGAFLLRGVPVGVNELRVLASGYKPVDREVEIEKPGSRVSNVTIEMEGYPLRKLFGFDVIVEREVVLDDGKVKISGLLINIPSNPLIRLSEEDKSLPFSNFILTENYKPASDFLELNIKKINVKVFDKFQGVFKDPDGNFLKVEWNERLKIGEIVGEIYFYNGKNFKRIPSTVWADEKASAVLTLRRNQLYSMDRVPIKITSDGSGISAETVTLDLKPLQKEVNYRIWGYVAEVDYRGARLDRKGFHYPVKIKVKGFPPLFFNELYINENFEGKIEDLKDKVTAKFPGFNLDITGGGADSSGIRVKGTFELKAPGMGGGWKFSYRNFYISPEGSFECSDIDIPDGLTFYGRKFELENIYLKSEKKGGSFNLSGKIKLEKLKEWVGIEKITYTEQSKIKATLNFNQTFNFADIVEIKLEKINFGADDGGRYLKVVGSFNFEIPSLRLHAGNLKYYETGRFLLEEFGLGFTAGPVTVDMEVSFREDGFEGKGELSVKPYFGIGGSFLYKNSRNWKVEVKTDTAVTIFPPYLTLTGVKGRLERENNIWGLALGGYFSMAKGTDYILEAYTELEVKTTPVISGRADFTAFKTFAFSKTEITLNLKEKKLTGSTWVGFDKYGINVRDEVEFAISPDYWFIGGKVEGSFLNILKTSSRFYLAWNYPYPHKDNPPVPISGNPKKGERISGIFFASYSGIRTPDVPVFHLSLSEFAYVFIKPKPFKFAGGYSVEGKASASVELWEFGIGIAGEFSGSAGLAYSRGISFSCDARGKVKGWVGCCKKRGCDGLDLCTKWFIPCGAKACFSLGVHLSYKSSRGWRFRLNCPFFCD